MTTDRQEDQAATARTFRLAERARSSPYYPALSHPFLRRWPVWPTMTGIVLGWGLALVPLGLPTQKSWLCRSFGGDGQ